MRATRTIFFLLVFSSVAAAEPRRGAMTWTLTVADHSSAALEQVEALIQSSRSAGEPVLVELFADWCGACRMLDRGALSDPAVIRALAGHIRIRVDVSAPDEFTAAISERFGARALPTLYFISARGTESHLAGTISAKELISMARNVH